jgi:hypothetical protein
VKLEVLLEDIGGKKLPGPLFPACEVKPIEGEGGLSAEIIPQDEKFRNLVFCLGLEKKRNDFRIGLAAFQSTDGQRTNQLFFLRDLERSLANAQRQRKTMQKQKQTPQAQLDELNGKIQQMEEEVTLLRAMNKKAVVQYRIYLPLEDYQLELFNSKIPPGKDTPRPKGSKTGN